MRAIHQKDFNHRGRVYRVRTDANGGQTLRRWRQGKWETVERPSDGLWKAVDAELAGCSTAANQTEREPCPRCGKSFKPLSPKVRARDIRLRTLYPDDDSRGPAGIRGHKCEPVAELKESTDHE